MAGGDGSTPFVSSRGHTFGLCLPVFGFWRRLGWDAGRAPASQARRSASRWPATEPGAGSRFGRPAPARHDLVATAAGSPHPPAAGDHGRASPTRRAPWRGAARSSRRSPAPLTAQRPAVPSRMVGRRLQFWLGNAPSRANRDRSSPCARSHVVAQAAAVRTAAGMVRQAVAGTTRRCRRGRLHRPARRRSSSGPGPPSLTCYPGQKRPWFLQAVGGWPIRWRWTVAVQRVARALPSSRRPAPAPPGRRTSARRAAWCRSQHVIEQRFADDHPGRRERQHLWPPAV